MESHTQLEAEDMKEFWASLEQLEDLERDEDLPRKKGRKRRRKVLKEIKYGTSA